MNIDNAALFKLKYVADTLENLEVSSCGDVSDSGVKELSQLTKLKQLKLADLIGVKHPRECLQSLKSSLPECQISYPGAEK